VNCNRELGFLPDLLWLASLDPVGNGVWRPTAVEAQSMSHRKCKNYVEEHVCNWTIPQEQQEATFCASSRLNEIIPDLSSEQNRGLWAKIESPKRRLVFTRKNPMHCPTAG
jgi:hypothetical protein